MAQAVSTSVGREIPQSPDLAAVSKPAEGSFGSSTVKRSDMIIHCDGFDVSQEEMEWYGESNLIEQPKTTLLGQAAKAIVSAFKALGELCSQFLDHLSTEMAASHAFKTCGALVASLSHSRVRERLDITKNDQLAEKQNQLEAKLDAGRELVNQVENLPSQFVSQSMKDDAKTSLKTLGECLTGGKRLEGKKLRDEVTAKPVDREVDPETIKSQLTNAADKYIRLAKAAKGMRTPTIEDVRGHIDQHIGQLGLTKPTSEKEIANLKSCLDMGQKVVEDTTRTYKMDARSGPWKPLVMRYLLDSIRSATDMKSEVPGDGSKEVAKS